MPSVRNVRSAQGSARVIQPSQRFFHRAAIANANGTESEAKPMNMTGGWMTIHGSWRRGFRPDAVGRRRRREQLERALLAEDRDDAEEGREVDDHHGRFLLLRAAPHEETDERAPEAPQQKRSLLPGPERRDLEVQRQVRARVRVDVRDVEAVLQEQRHQDRRRGHDRDREGRVRRPRERQQVPAPAIHAQVGDRRGEAGEESAPDRRDAGPDVHQETLPGGGFGRVRLLDLGALVLGGALHEQLLRVDAAVAVAADRDDRDGVLEVAGPDAAIDDRHAAAVRVDEVEGELLVGRVVTVALLVERAHDLDDAPRLLRLVEGQVGRERLLERGQAEAHEGEREDGGDPVAPLHRTRSFSVSRRSSRQR